MTQHPLLTPMKLVHTHACSANWFTQYKHILLLDVHGCLCAPGGAVGIGKLKLCWAPGNWGAST